MKTTLIPISLSNDRFSTNNVVRLVELLEDSESRIEILIADRIQIYNRVINALRGRWQKLDIGRIEIGVSQTSEQRKKWSDKLIRRLSLPRERILVSDVNQYIDIHFFDVFRRILILYDVDSNFFKDIIDYAEQYVIAKFAGEESSFIELARKMSVRYVLEEAAISIRVRCFGSLYEEFYFGEPVKPIVNLYGDQYMFSLAEVSGVLDIESRKFLFVNADAAAPAF